MKQPKFFLYLLIVFLFPAFVYAGDIKTETKEVTNFLGASLEMSQMSLKGGTISGNGFKVDFDHYFTQKVAIEVYLSTAINATGGVSNSYTGIGGYVYYTLFGNCCDIRKTVTHEGVPVLVETDGRKNSLQLGAGLDQFLLNGTKSVYSISGIGAGAQYQFVLFNYHLKASARYSMMSANKETVNGMFLGLGIVFGL